MCKQQLRSRYTLVPDAGAQAYVDHVVETIRAKILERLGTENCRAILLTGSFGRGEGGVRKRGKGWEIVNDIELLVIQDEPTRHLLEGLGEELAKRFGIYSVDIGGRVTSRLELTTPTMSNYDERYGSQVIYGDSSIVERMGELDARDMAVWEGARLMLNRGGGLILHFTWSSYLARDRLGDDERQYMKNQLVKAAVGLGDAITVSKGLYDALYERRYRAFQGLVAQGSVQLPANESALIERGYREKLLPGTHRIFDDLFTCYEQLMRPYFPVFLEIMSQHFHAHLRDLESYARVMRKHRFRKPAIRDTLAWRTLRAAKRSVTGLRLPRREDWQDRHRTADTRKATVYAAIPLVLRSAPFLSTPDYADLELAEKLFSTPARHNTRVEKRWEAIRSTCFEQWYATIH